jgi:hypothetical protein
MGFSLFAAFVFTPWCSYKLRPRLEALTRAEEREHRTQEIIGKIYRPIVSPFIRSRPLAWVLLATIVAAFLLACSMFYTKAVTVKMLPFDNKPEFNVVVNLPEGTALPVTTNATLRLAKALREVPEVTAIQTYVGTVSPFNFNGMVRHYYLRQNPWEGDLLVMLKDKKERDRGSHAIATEARSLLTPIAQAFGARIAVVEMPPGPPVLQTVVTEVYGPNAEVRRQTARDLRGIFEDVPNIVDADTYMADPHDYRRFDVDAEKAVRRGVSVDAVNQNLAMAMGGFRLGDVKRGTVLEPTYIVLQVPLANRADLNSLGSLPIATPSGEVVPLAELGRFVQVPEDPLIYHKDLRAMEYVVGEMEGFLGAPIYGMFGVEDRLKDYTTPDGVRISGMPWGLIGPPQDDSVSGFEWTGEWTVTYETFRDMGLAFMAALLLIYGLIVWQFRDLALSGLIMAPIPLTLVGIIPGHWIMGAEFTATSMIGLIALGGIIVRQSILIVEFVKIEVAKGRNVTDAALTGAEIRMRPILITSLTTIGGAWTLMFDPIFQGMAVSVFFGASVGTFLAVIVIPLGCITMRRRFYLVETETGEIRLSQRYYVTELGGPPRRDLVETAEANSKALPAPTKGVKRTPGWLRVLLWLWGLLVSGLFWLVDALARSIGALEGRFFLGGGGGPRHPGPGKGPSGGPPAPAGAAPVSAPPVPTSSNLGGAQARRGNGARLPSFAAGAPPEVNPTEAQPVEGTGTAPLADVQRPDSGAVSKKKRAARAPAVAKRAPAASSSGDPPPARARKPRVTTGGTTTRAKTKKASPARGATSRPKRAGGKSPGLVGPDPGVRDPKPV